MIQLNNNLGGLMAKLEAAKKTNSPYMKNTLSLFLDGLKLCVGECVGVAFFAIVFVPLCAVCLKHKVGDAIDVEQKRVAAELEKTRKFFDGMISSFRVYQEISIVLLNKATDQKIALDHFRSTLTTMESSLAANINLLFLNGYRKKIYDQMNPLQAACDELRKHF